MDQTTLKYLIDCKIFPTAENYPKSFIRAIFDHEVKMSRKIIEKGWNIGSLLARYKNVDYTFKTKKLSDYPKGFFLGDICYKKYRGKLWKDEEVVFIKGNRTGY